MAPAANVEDKLEFLLACLKNAEVTFNYHKIAEETGYANGSKAQVKLKRVVEESGKYKMTAGKIHLAGKNAQIASAEPRRPGRPKKVTARKTTVSKPTPKKRKIVPEVEEAEEVEDFEEHEDDNEDNTKGNKDEEDIDKDEDWVIT